MSLSTAIAVHLATLGIIEKKYVPDVALVVQNVLYVNGTKNKTRSRPP